MLTSSLVKFKLVGEKGTMFQQPYFWCKEKVDNSYLIRGVREE